MQATSLYVHIPFCDHRCAYCDFNTYASMQNWIPRYIQALRREMETVAANASERIPIHTVFFGGGTPSLLPLDELEMIVSTIYDQFSARVGLEFTLEANPGTLSLEYLRGLRELGVNRLSLGMQSANPEELALLTRIHDFPDVIRSVEWARKAGFDNLSLDLIFALPGQSLARWEDNLRLALKLAPDHISLYNLTVEEKTPLHRWARRGLVDLPDADLAADMYELTMDRLGENGFVQYEISNWARRKEDGSLRSSRHNLQYWRALPYLGLGAGAHGYAKGTRTANVGPIPAYVHRMETPIDLPFPQSPANSQAHALTLAEDQADFMMVGLRLTEEGISDKTFQQRFGRPLEEAYPAQIRNLSQAGLLEWAEGGASRCLRLTRRGRLLGNQVFVRFI